MECWHYVTSPRNHSTVVVKYTIINGANSKIAITGFTAATIENIAMKSHNKLNKKMVNVATTINSTLWPTTTPTTIPAAATNCNTAKVFENKIES